MNGAYDGLQDIRQRGELSPAGDAYATTVRAVVLNPDGSLRAESCGEAEAERVGLD